MTIKGDLQGQEIQSSILPATNGTEKNACVFARARHPRLSLQNHTDLLPRSTSEAAVSLAFAPVVLPEVALMRR